MRELDCPNCDGEGAILTTEDCGRCDGSGHHPTRDGELCPDCTGSGKEADECPLCGGTGENEDDA